MPKFIGPFKISDRINEVAYKLQLPDSMSIHNVFHISLLKPYYEDGNYQPPPLPIVMNDKPYYEVEYIINHRDVRKGKRIERQYLVKWLNYGPEHNTWEPISSFESTDVIETYLQSLLNIQRMPKRHLKRSRT